LEIWHQHVRQGVARSVAPPPHLCHDAGAVPTYDYQCRSCGTVTEVIHAMTADGPTVCELCGGALRRVLYPAGIIFKGSGFYRTDSRASTGSGDAPATSGSGEAGGSASKGSSTGSSGGDATKPAATGGSGATTDSSGPSGSKGSAGSSSGGESAA
jgi:putative FmdB family regulatory protein